MDEACFGRHTSDDGGKTIKCHAALQPKPAVALQQGRLVSRIRKSFARLAAPPRGWTGRPAGLVFES
jgi:hypothetical protein